MRRGKAGFSLIELLVVITIISILAAILFPVFAQAKNAAKAIVCISNMRQIGMATMLYLESNDGQYYPAAYIEPLAGFSDQVTWVGYDNNNTGTLVAGFYGDVTKPAKNPRRRGLLDGYLVDERLRECPNRRGGVQTALALNLFDPNQSSPYYTTNPNAAGQEFGPSAYQVNMVSGVTTSIGAHESMVEEPSNTLLMWEHFFSAPVCNFLQPVDWYLTPPDTPTLKEHFNLLHNGGTSTLWCDGHAKRIAYGNLRRPMFSVQKYIYGQ